MLQRCPGAQKRSSCAPQEKTQAEAGLESAPAGEAAARKALVAQLEAHMSKLRELEARKVTMLERMAVVAREEGW